MSIRGIGPGPDTLIGGDLQAGFYGEVTGLITADDLRTATGVSQGTAMQTGDITWLKFAHQHKTLFIAKQPIQHSISWDHLNAQGVVSSFSEGGGKLLEINGGFYLVRLMQGCNVNPAPNVTGDSPAGTTGINNEWDNLIIPVHGEGGWAQYTNADIVVASGDGRATWCQEVHSNDLTRRVIRGRYSVSYFHNNTSSNTASARGWRPVLELLSGEGIILYHLLKSGGKYYSYQDGEFIEVSATQENFEQYGVDLNELVTPTDKVVKSLNYVRDEGSGKEFSVIVDPLKYKGINSITKK